MIGSSPRGRGTPQLRRSPPSRWRFIPAWAGNAGRSVTAISIASVHPRVGGERFTAPASTVLATGSSPRGRGTPPSRWNVAKRHRFIPAWAGNAGAGLRARACASVHPRVGGERLPVLSDDASAGGSSPRGRGTRRRARDRRGPDRFIPAWAGNAADPNNRYVMIDGSSPRGRGTQHFPLPPALRLRFIPAWAGNATRPRRGCPTTSVHPRVGGERLVGIVGHGWPSGSSPRGRGTPRAGERRARAGRFIPAWAGNARGRLSTIPCTSVHPRVGGERASVMPSEWSWIGSSPRGRGTLLDVPLHVPEHRFIPAWAGNATSRCPACSRPTVHPRVGGERGPDRCRPCCRRGSSPRGRGTRPRRPARCRRNRFIPAWAGNALVAST